MLSLCCFKVMASHIVGGEVTYIYMGDTIKNGHFVHKYQVSLSIYEDCQNGQPEAIAEDNPAFLSLYDLGGDTSNTVIDSMVFFSSAVSVPANFSNTCVSNIPAICLTKKTFIKTYYLKPNAAGYIVTYQRCCRNASVVNIVDPGDKGSTYFCIIPGGGIVNNSAVFKNYPPQIICLNNPLFYDNSATDADGDSLSYEFCTAQLGASDANIKPIPLPPDLVKPYYYDSVAYAYPYSSQVPITGFPAIQIDPVTGLVTGTPNQLGRYLVTVCCNEWRHGVLVNTIKREFQFVVTDCSKVVVANIPQYSTDPNTYIINCIDYKVHFVNTSSGGFAYDWNFGVPGATNDTSTEFEPTFIYPDTGTFAVKLIVNPGTTCPDSITRLVKIYPRFIAAFSDSGKQCPGQPISFQDQSIATIKPITYWKWNFGDGDSSMLQNPLHSYVYGGTYNVILVSQNVKHCIDTAIKQVLIEAFTPFAGNDTIIVKGESIYFNATGGTQYTWTPSVNLSDTSIYNPVGYYPDTGHYTYYIHIQSPFGCAGDDTMRVTVVNEASFFIPTAFTPNGDGLNDIFRPVAVGYRSLKHFRIFNRWGQRVYDGNTLEVGWDGTFNNHLADMGTYFWEMGFIDRFGKEGYLKGDVTLIR